jgi:hypothetical protein
MSTVDVVISKAYTQHIISDQALNISLNHKGRHKKGREISLFSTASPLFFKISAMVTTVAIAVHVT